MKKQRGPIMIFSCVVPFSASPLDDENDVNVIMHRLFEFQLIVANVAFIK